MSNYNKVLLMGRLTRDPELRYTPQGIPVSEIGLAVNREYLAGTERRKETTFLDITLWRRQAEVVCQYLKKGAPIFIEGHLALDSWEGQDGQKRSKLRVVADNFQFLGSRQEGEASRQVPPEEAGQEGGFSAPPRRPFQPRGAPAAGGGPGTAPARFQPGGRLPQGELSPVPVPEGEEAPPGPPQEKEPDGSLGLEEGEIPF